MVIALEMAAVLMRRLSPDRRAGARSAAALEARQHQAARHQVYTEYLYPLQIAAVMLLVAIIAAIALTLRARKDTKHIDPSRAGQGEEGRPRAHRVDEARAARRATPPSDAAKPVETGDEPRPVTLGHYLSLGAILFALSVIGIFLNRKNLIVLLMAIELMLLAVNMNFVAFSHYLGDMAGQVFVFFILTVAAAESAIGLAILVVLFRNALDDRRRRARHAEGLSRRMAAPLSLRRCCSSCRWRRWSARSSPACSASRSAAPARTRSTILGVADLVRDLGLGAVRRRGRRRALQRDGLRVDARRRR